MIEKEARLGRKAESLTLAVVEYGSATSDPAIRIDGCRVPPQTARPRIFHHPDAKPAFIQESNGGCQLDTGWGSFSCGGEGVVFSYESAAAPLLTGGQEA